MRRLIDWIMALLGRVPGDKCRHAAVMAWVAAFALLAARVVGFDGLWAVAISCATVTVAGLWKEFCQDVRADIWDLVANYVGALAVWLAYIVE